MAPALKHYYSDQAVSTTLSSTIINTDTTMTVASVSGFPATFPYYLCFERGTGNQEFVEIVGSNGSTTLYITRGLSGSTAVGHTAGVLLEHIVPGQFFNDQVPRRSVFDFGMVGNYRTVGDGACSTGANTKITSATIAFTNKDLGKRITMTGAAASSLKYVGTITNIDSATQVTVSPVVGATISATGLAVSTDNTAAWAAATTWVNAQTYPGAILEFPPGETNGYGITAGQLFNKPVLLAGSAGAGGYSQDAGDYTKSGGTAIFWDAPNSGPSTWVGAFKWVPVTGGSAQPIVGMGARDISFYGYNNGQNNPLYWFQMYDCVAYDIRNSYFMDAICGIEMNVAEPLGNTAATARGNINGIRFRQLENTLPTGATLTPTTTSSAVTLTATGQSLTIAAANGLIAAGYVWIMTENGYPVLVNYTGGGGTTTLTGCSVSPEDAILTPKTLSGSNVVQAVPNNGPAFKCDGSTTANTNLSLHSMIQISSGTNWGPASIEMRNCDSMDWQLIAINGGSAVATNAINRATRVGIRFMGSDTSVGLGCRNNVFRNFDPGAGGVLSLGLKGGGAKLAFPAGPNYCWDYQLGNGAPAPTIEANSYLEWTANGGFAMTGLRAIDLTANTAYTAATAKIIPGSIILMDPQAIQIGTTFRWKFQIAKTAAGVAARTTNIRIGTAGTTADAVVQAWSTATSATIDTAIVEITYTITAANSASSTGIGAMLMFRQLQAGATGLSTTLGYPIVLGTPTVFTSPVSGMWYISLSMTTGTGEVATTSMCTAEIVRIGLQAA